MAPEQVRGEVADHRTDLFAFGAILYEMLTGQRAFRGDSSIETLNAILKDAPEDLSASGRAAPPALGRIVHRCLEKRPEDRFQSSRDLAFDLETLEKTSSSQSVGVSALGGAPAPRSRREKLWMGAAAVLGLLAAGLAAGLVITSGSPVAERAPVRFQIHPPPDALFTSPEIGGAVALSPDGRNLLFVVTRTGGATELWMRPLDEVEARQVPGTEGAQYPFWSPDSRSIGFFADGHLKRVDLLGSPPQTVCAAPSGRGGSWGSDDIIIFAAEAGGPLSRVPANGLSPPEPLTALDASRGESSHRFPAFYGEGRRFMFLAKASGPENEGVFVGSLDGDPPRLLVPGPFNAVHAPPEFVLYSREGALVARSLDDRSVELEGDQVLVAPSLTRATRSRGYASFSAARGGVLAYQPGGATGITDTHMGWVDRDGREVGTVYPPGTAFRDQALSPDGTLIAVNAEDEETGTHDLYIVDAATGHATRLTFEPTHEWLPVWSPDGQQIAYGSTQGEGAEKVCVKPSSGAGETRILFAPDQGARPNDWSADGSYIVCEVGSTAVDRDLWVLPVDGTDAGDPFPFLETEADEFMGQLSPDGKWMAYASKESGRTEIYVRPFPSGGGKWQISTEGATQPRWRADGKELYFLGLDQTVVAVPIESGRPGFRTGRSEKLFHAPLLANAVGTDEYVPSSDGQRFLIAYSIEEAGLSTPITVVLDWQEALKRAR
jgi:Tol biopolymer transport system component